MGPGLPGIHRGLVWTEADPLDVSSLGEVDGVILRLWAGNDTGKCPHPLCAELQAEGVT